jgi:hypothetical protein
MSELGRVSSYVVCQRIEWLTCLCGCVGLRGEFLGMVGINPGEWVKT